MSEHSPKLPPLETPISNIKPPERNPALRMMGIPNLKLKLPSRNWMIFLSVTSSIASFILYDKYQTRKIREKWCRAVSHLAEEPLGIKVMPRKLTIYLSAPPGDGLKSARDHFAEYVKPILDAAAMDWDVVEGRREGDVRVRLAERVRELRRRAGEGELEPENDSVADVRRASGVNEWSGEAGDIVIGRNTWKEYIRGLHEGWLGPLTQPTAEPLPPVAPEPLLPAPTQEPMAEVDAPQYSAQESPADPPPTSPDRAATPTKAPLTSKTPPYIPTAEYSSATLPPSLPQTIGPSTALPFPHILGFFNTPIRLYRFMTRRWLAEAIGRETTAVVLGTFRPFQELRVDDSASNVEGGSRPEQEELLAEEELEWIKSVRVREEAEQQRERVWLDPVILDSRIAERMRRFELSAEDERAASSAKGQEGRNRDEEVLK